jgi:hypothetical protein
VLALAVDEGGEECETAAGYVDGWSVAGDKRRGRT